tara:strand:+ start:2692 stop:3069 length:378 start_codon:yes stop_codon:yes gene_type:complete
MCHFCKNKDIDILSTCPECNKEYCNNCFISSCYLIDKNEELYCCYKCECDITFALDIRNIPTKYYKSIFNDYHVKLVKNNIRKEIDKIKANLKNEIKILLKELIDEYKNKKRKTIPLEEIEILIK